MVPDFCGEPQSRERGKVPLNSWSERQDAEGERLEGMPLPSLTDGETEAHWLSLLSLQTPGSCHTLSRFKPGQSWEAGRDD